MNPKPNYAKQKRKRKADQKAEKWAKAYGSEGYVQAVTSHPCAIAWRNGRASVKAACVYVNGRSEAAHVVKKTHDDPLATWRGLFPCCSQHHQEGEGKDPIYYIDTYGVDIKVEAQLMVEAYAHLAEAA